MEEDNIKSGASADVAPKNVDTVTPVTPDDQTSIASQIADGTSATEEPVSEQTPPREVPAPVAPPEPESGSGSPVPPSSPTEQTSTFSIAPKKSGGSKLGLIIALAVVLLCGAAVAAYFAFSKSVDKNALVTEAIEKAIYAEVTNFSGSFNTSESGADVNVSFIGAIDTQNHAKLQLDISVNQSPASINLQGQAIVNNSDIYIKLDGINEAITNMFDAFPSEYLTEESSPISSIISFITKVDGEWIKITADDVETYVGVDVNTCTTYSAGLKGDLITAYKNNSFIVVGDELGERDGSIGYRISIDQSKSQAFSRALSSSSSASNFINCIEGSGLPISSILDDSSSSASTPGVNAEIWINKDSHEVTNLQLNTVVDSGSITLKLNAKSKGVIDIQIPSSYMTFTEVSSDLQAAILGLMSSYSYESDYDYDTDFDFDDSDSTLECTPENGCTIVE